MIAPIAAPPKGIAPVPMLASAPGFASILSDAAEASPMPPATSPIAGSGETIGLAVEEAKVLPPEDVVNVMTTQVRTRHGAANIQPREGASAFPMSANADVPIAPAPVADELPDDRAEDVVRPMIVPIAPTIAVVLQPMVRPPDAELQLDRPDTDFVKGSATVEAAVMPARIVVDAELPANPSTLASEVVRIRAPAPRLKTPANAPLPALFEAIAAVSFAIPVGQQIPLRNAPVPSADLPISTKGSEASEATTAGMPAADVAAPALPALPVVQTAIPGGRQVLAGDGHAPSNGTEISPTKLPSAAHAGDVRLAFLLKAVERQREPAAYVAATTGSQVASSTTAMPRQDHRAPPFASRETTEAPVPGGFAVDTTALGSVGAEVIRHSDERGDRLHVRFAVERSATASLITSGDGLDRALAAAGARLDTVTVEVRGDRSATTMTGGQSSPRNEDRPPPRPPESPRRVTTTTPATSPISNERFA